MVFTASASSAASWTLAFAAPAVAFWTFRLSSSANPVESGCRRIKRPAPPRSQLHHPLHVPRRGGNDLGVTLQETGLSHSARLPPGAGDERQHFGTAALSTGHGLQPLVLLVVLPPFGGRLVVVQVPRAEAPGDQDEKPEHVAVGLPPEPEHLRYVAGLPRGQPARVSCGSALRVRGFFALRSCGTGRGAGRSAGSGIGTTVTSPPCKLMMRDIRSSGAGCPREERDGDCVGRPGIVSTLPMTSSWSPITMCSRVSSEVWWVRQCRRNREYSAGPNAERRNPAISAAPSGDSVSAPSTAAAASSETSSTDRRPC